MAKLGIDEFRRLVQEERASLETEPEWSDWLKNISTYAEAGLPQPVSAGQTIELGDDQAEYERWKSTNIYQQRQPGFVAVTIALPLGDINSDQTRRLADVVRQFTQGHPSHHRRAKPAGTVDS